MPSGTADCDCVDKVDDLIREAEQELESETLNSQNRADIEADIIALKSDRYQGCKACGFTGSVTVEFDQEYPGGQAWF